MDPWILCGNCRSRTQFPAALTGHAVACPSCGYVLRVEIPPDAPPPRGPALSDTGVRRWHLRFPSGRQFGPVQPDMLLEWVREGRADADCHVCPEDGDAWLRLGDAFASWFGGDGAEASVDEGAMPFLPEYIPAVGLLQHLREDPGALTGAVLREHMAALGDLQDLCAGTGGAIRVAGKRSLLMGETRLTGGHNPRLPEQLRPEHALVVELSTHGTSFYLVVPWCSMGRLPHEFFSLMPGRLPHSLALRRESDEDFGQGVWIGANGGGDDILALAAARSPEPLAEGIATRWFSPRRDYTMAIIWGVQAIPLGDGKFVHAVQSAERAGPDSYGLLWYLERQRAFYRFARRLSIPDTHEPHILFASCTGQLLVDVTDHLLDAFTAAAS